MGQTQSDTGSGRTSAELTPEQKEELYKKRSLIAAEIWQTEKTYVKRLDGLIRLYKKPLLRAVEDKKPIISEDNINHIFSNVEVIRDFQEKLLYELEGRINKWSDKELIGDIFVKNADGLKLYVEYVNNYDRALQTIRTLSKENDKFKEFLKDNEAREAGEQQSIHSLLITVVQRPPRYCLLLKELLKNTPDSHKDRKNVASALHAVEQAADWINDQKMIAEGRERSLQIRKLFQDKIAYASTTGPKIEFEGELKTAKKVKYFVVIFSDYILIGEDAAGFLGKKKAKYDPRVFVPISQVQIIPTNETTLTINFGTEALSAPSPSSSSSSSLSVNVNNDAGTVNSRSNSLSSSSPAPKSPGTRSPARSPAPSSPPPVIESASTIIEIPSIIFVWDSADGLKSWQNIVVERQKAVKNGEPKKAAPTGFFSWFKW